jgi:hypothetical protein
MPRFTVEFYKPRVLDQNGPRFEDILNQIIGMNAADRIRRGDDPAAVLGLRRDGNEFLGEAARIRMDDLPSVIDVANGARHDLDVEEQEGLGEEIHFLYDVDLDVIAIQNRGHFRAPALERLLGDLTHTNLDFHVILTEGGWERFQRMDFVTKINFKLARPRDLGHRPQPALDRVFREIDEFNGVSAKMEITVGRLRAHGLNMISIRQVVQSFRGDRENFKSLSITGAIRETDEQDAPSHIGIVDFIKERLLHTEEVERRGRGRRLDAESCRVALRRAIRDHREYLRRHQ